MARNIIIPITDHDDACTLYYLVQYKLTTETSYTTFQWFDDQIEINNLADDSTYDVIITRYCCTGTTSTPTTIEVDTTVVSPQLDAPANFSMSPGGGSGCSVQATWDAVPNAVTYVMQVQQGVVFPGGTDFREESFGTTSGAIGDLDGCGISYGGRVKATAPGYEDSEWSAIASANAT